MVEFKIRIHPEQHLAYIPKEIAETLGRQVKAVPNRTAVLLYPENISIKQVIKSTRIILQDLEHAIDLESHVRKRRFQEKKNHG